MNEGEATAGRKRTKVPRPGWRLLRRLSQAAVFALFFFLFLNTEYKDDDILRYAVNIFLRLDPLVAGAAVIAGRALVSLVWPSLVVIGLTLLLGRFFCGWVCPLGAVLDFTSATAFRKVKRRKGFAGWPRAKYYVLAFLLASAALTLQFVFLLDPVSLLIRSFALSVYPAANFVVHSLLGPLYDTPLAPLSEPVYGFLRDRFLAFEQPHFRMAGLVGTIFLAILLLEGLQKRFWCRNLCPLGAFFALAGRFGLVRRRVSDPDCIDCGICRRDCRMGAIDEGFRRTEHGECVECMDCRALCPEEAIRFSGPLSPGGVPLDLPRRRLVGSLVLGAATVPLFKVEAHSKAPHPKLIRPPGALPEPQFLARCTRCGECMRVCIANGLQPSFLEGGLPALWSPVLVPRIGYCEYLCTLCGQVCPTGAITRLPVEEKKLVKLGLASIDRSLCLPWKGASECIVCEEHCPTFDKAIKMKEGQAMTVEGEARTFKQPYVDESLCIGCGICETKCPLERTPAITVSSRGESRAQGGGPQGYPS